MNQEDLVRKYLERCYDPTGTLRRYAESLRGKSTWEQVVVTTNKE